jgi:pantetheine-phosphate adenylyltransferase
MRVAILPGTFDPLTNGHVDVIRRATTLFDRVVVAILLNTTKTPLFSVDERIAMVREVFAAESAIEVDTFSGLVVEYARRRGAVALVRGLRSVGDFDYERQMALMNRHLAPSIESLYLMTSADTAHISATLVREIAALGGSIADLVPRAVQAHFERRRPSATVKV